MTTEIIIFLKNPDQMTSLMGPAQMKGLFLKFPGKVNFAYFV